VRIGNDRDGVNPLCGEIKEYKDILLQNLFVKVNHNNGRPLWKNELKKGNDLHI
jgi:hypothetical protein